MWRSCSTSETLFRDGVGGKRLQCSNDTSAHGAFGYSNVFKVFAPEFSSCCKRIQKPFAHLLPTKSKKWPFRKAEFRGHKYCFWSYLKVERETGFEPATLSLGS